MDRNTEYYRIIMGIAIHEKIEKFESLPENDRKFINFLTVNGYLYKDGSEYKVDKKGYNFLEGSLPFDEFNKLQNSNTSGNVTIIGNIHDSSLNTGNIHQSPDLSQRTKFVNPQTNTQKLNNPKNKSFIEIASWIAGIVSAIIGLYLIFK